MIAGMWKALVIASLLVGCSKKEDPKLEKLPAEFKAEADKIANGLADKAKDVGDKAKDVADKVGDKAEKVAGAAKDLGGDVVDDVKHAASGDACSGGNCMQTCAAGKTCKFSCSGGNCTQTCEKDSICEITCSGGGCTQKCDGPCKKTCSGENCK